MLGTLSSARADERFFSYVEEAEVTPKGEWEFEQWLTYRKGYPGGDRNFDQHIWDFREEIEYGITDRLSGSLYLNFRNDHYVARTEGFQNSSEFNFNGVSGELKYQVLNPNTQPVGLALYFEPTYGSDEQELEYKIIFSKNLGDKWVLAANITYEQEWEKEEGLTVRESVLEFTAGASYRITPHWSAGLEARHHAVYEGIALNDHLGTGVFVGPNVHYGTAKWGVTLTVMPQVTGNPSDSGINRSEHQTFETRLIVAIDL